MKQLEQKSLYLSVNPLLSIIEKRIHELNELKSKINDEHVNDTPQRIRVVSRRKQIQFYIREHKHDQNGRYMKKEEEDKALNIITKDYERMLNNAADSELVLLKKLQAFYSAPYSSPEKTYLKLSPVRRQFVNPVYITDQELIDRWLAQKYSQKDFADNATEFYTENGERVRSKSEILIANNLKKYGIPYKYECRLDLRTGIVYPDFTILDVKRRRIIYWEHLGMMDDPDYCSRALNKITKYEEEGIFPGDRLIITFETSKQPISTRIIEKTIQQYIL